MLFFRPKFDQLIMRVRSREKVRYKNIILTFFAILPFSFIGLFANNISILYNEMTAFSFVNPYDNSTLEQFIPANDSLLAFMAYFYDNQFVQYHIPLNYTVATIFTNATRNIIASYSYSDNGALWTGTAMNGWVHEYLAAIRENNSTLEQNALITIRKLISGMAMEIIVPNGGLGQITAGYYHEVGQVLMIVQ